MASTQTFNLIKRTELQMRQTGKHILAITASISLAILINTNAWSSDSSSDTFILKSTSRSMSDVVNSVKAFSKQKHWVYLGDFKVKKGKVILVKFCVKAAGKKAWKAGLKVSAMLPCGSMGVYQKDGKTEISLLNPNFMNKLYPNQNLKDAANLLTPLYTEMMTAITK